MRKDVFGFVLLFAAAMPADSRADEQVNIATTGNQGSPDVSMEPDGDFVVVWHNRNETVTARQFDAAGAPLTGEVVLDSFEAEHGVAGPSIDRQPAGDFVVTWMDGAYVVEEGFQWQTHHRRFTDALVPIGTVQTITGYRQSGSSVATGPAGEFVVVWNSFYQPIGSDYVYGGVGGGLHDAAGTVIGNFAPEPIPSPTEVTTGQGSVDMAPDGTFVVVWRSPIAPTPLEHRVNFRRFDAAGQPLGALAAAPSSDFPEEACPAVGAAANGFLVAWHSDGSTGNDSLGSSIQARRFTSTGTPRGPQFQVNEVTTGDQICPIIATEPSGDFMVVWTSASSAGTDTSQASIQSRRVFSNGQLGPQLQVNTYTPGRQLGGNISTDGNGNFVVVWTGYGSAGTDNNPSSQSVQSSGPLRFDQLLHDGFETGDTSRWFATSPAFFQ